MTPKIAPRSMSSVRELHMKAAQMGNQRKVRCTRMGMPRTVSRW